MMRYVMNHALAMTFIAAVLSSRPVHAETPLVPPIRVSDPYPLATCPVTGYKLGLMGEPVSVLVDGREIKLCCDVCRIELRSKKKEILAMIDARVVETQRPHYPVDTCPVTGKELGVMGEPVDYVYGFRLVRLCCDDCIEGFEASPEKYLDQLDLQTVQSQLPLYFRKTCPVSGKTLGPNAVNAIVGGQLIRLCCTDCVPELAARGQEIAVEAKPKTRDTAAPLLPHDPEATGIMPCSHGEEHGTSP